MEFFEDDELVPCPMDSVHMVARKRMPYHIMKYQKVICAYHFLSFVSAMLLKYPSNVVVLPMK